MNQLTQKEQKIVKGGLIPELLRDGFRETQGEFVRERGSVRHVVAFRRSQQFQRMFRIPIGLSFSGLSEQYQSLFRFVPSDLRAHTFVVHRSTFLPEIDGAGDFDWWFDGKRDPDAMSRSIAHSWREYGRVWLDSRSTLPVCARDTLKAGGRVKAAIFFLAAGERENAEQALQEEISSLQYRDDRRVRNLIRSAKRYGVTLPDLSEELKWKRHNDVWNSHEGWEACVNPYHAEVMMSLWSDESRSRRLVGIALTEQYCSDLKAEERQALREALEIANGVPHSVDCPIELQNKVRDQVQLVRYGGRGIISTYLPYPYEEEESSQHWGPKFAGEFTNLSPEQIAEMTKHCSAAMHIIRDIIGSPLSSFRFNPTYRTESVIMLAREIFDHSRFELCPVLADLLDEEGYRESQLLNHLRSNERHYAGCWAIDAILGTRETMPFTPPRPAGLHNDFITLDQF